mmetsp:Transcript_38810/g.69454  ORF Transcript_38810/g.69454 Transcript_38810/m.69454 type:complete len:212 (+) Transcript_38810:2939-3574(+)
MAGQQVGVDADCLHQVALHWVGWAADQRLQPLRVLRVGEQRQLLQDGRRGGQRVGVAGAVPVLGLALPQCGLEVGPRGLNVALAEGNGDQGQLEWPLAEGEVPRLAHLQSLGAGLTCRGPPLPLAQYPHQQLEPAHHVIHGNGCQVGGRPMGVPLRVLLGFQPRQRRHKVSEAGLGLVPQATQGGQQRTVVPGAQLGCDVDGLLLLKGNRL